MAVPRQKVDWAERVVVAVEAFAGSGLFNADDRLHAETVEMSSDDEVASARVLVRMDAAGEPAEAMSEYHSDRRMIIRAGEFVLFDGYPSRSRFELCRSSQGRGGRNENELVLILEHVVGRLDRDVRAQIIGRHVRDAVICEGMQSDPAAWAARSVLVTALPCVFNPNGRGNCDPVPLQIDECDGTLRLVHVFADDARDDAIPWTLARILRYLLHFYHWPSCPVGTREVFEQTDAVCTSSDQGREAFASTNELFYALLGRPETLSVEAASLLGAIGLISAASSLHLTAESRSAGQGVATTWRLWSELSGPRKELRLATAARGPDGTPVYRTADKNAIDLFTDNNVCGLSITWDARTIGETALVFGDVKRYELTAELLPGWLPEEGLDNVTIESRASAKEEALNAPQCLVPASAVVEDSWYRKYHRDGAEFAQHWQVGRLWVLNEAGTYAPALYNRNPPFDAYAPFGFSAIFPGRWMRRRRTLLPLSLLPGEEECVHVEVSFDSGRNWMPVRSGYTVLVTECGIWFDVPDLRSIAPPDADEQTNLWSALIDQTCRVRVTAQVESDERLAVEISADSAPSLHRNASLLYAPQRFKFLRRSSEPAASPPQSGSPSRDDFAAMQAVAQSLAAVRGSRSITGAALIPWLDTDYPVGSCVVELRGRSVGFACQREPAAQHAFVVGKRYHFAKGRFETELLLSCTAARGQRGQSEG
jgi:hypothetical protein